MKNDPKYVAERKKDIRLKKKLREFEVNDHE